MITNIIRKYRDWRMHRFLSSFQKHIQRYDNMMKYSGIKRRQRRRWKKQLVGAYEITVDKLFAQADGKRGVA